MSYGVYKNTFDFSKKWYSKRQAEYLISKGFPLTETGHNIKSSVIAQDIEMYRNELGIDNAMSRVAEFTICECKNPEIEFNYEPQIIGQVGQPECQYC